MNRYLAPTLTVAILAGTIATAMQQDKPASWQAPSISYESCQKTGGQMPEFFSSVDIQTTAETITFDFQTKEHGEISLEYIPDGVVRRGPDHHYLADGTMMADLPAHEASYWEDGQLVREEITYLPDNTYAIETNKLSIDDDGVLSYKLHVDGNLFLTSNLQLIKKPELAKEHRLIRRCFVAKRQVAKSYFLGRAPELFWFEGCA